MTLGVDHGRVTMLAAVIEKRMGLEMVSHDIFVNTVGGVRVDDPGVDMAIVAALVSSYLERLLPTDLVVLGEVGLTGEVRPISQPRVRVREARRLGFGRLLLPRASLEQALEQPRDQQARGVDSVEEAWEWLNSLNAAAV